MNTTARHRLIASLVLALPVLPAWAADANAEHGKATLRCEDEVADTVRAVRGKDVQDLQFLAGKRVLATDGDDIAVKGEGHYRRAGASVGFAYSCAFNVKTGATSGVVLRDTAAAGNGKPWQPDLSQVSPEACETAVAAVLKDQHPRVSGISFRSDTRKLLPASDTRLGLEGLGQMQRAPGMNLQDFNYRCEFDPRSGKVLSARAGG